MKKQKVKIITISTIIIITMVVIFLYFRQKNALRKSNLFSEQSTESGLKQHMLAFKLEIALDEEDNYDKYGIKPDGFWWIKVLKENLTKEEFLQSQKEDFFCPADDNKDMPSSFYLNPKLTPRKVYELFKVVRSEFVFDKKILLFYERENFYKYDGYKNTRVVLFLESVAPRSKIITNEEIKRQIAMTDEIYKDILKKYKLRKKLKTKDEPVDAK